MRFFVHISHGDKGIMKGGMLIYKKIGWVNETAEYNFKSDQ